jgi:hypothetical protein
MPSTSHNVELVLYADKTVIMAMYRKPTLLVSYLESYLSELHRWLSEWRTAINVSRKTAIIITRAGRRFIQHGSVTLFEELMQWFESTRYLGINLDKRLTLSPHIDQVRKKTTQRMAMKAPILSRKSNLSFKNVVLLYKQLIRPMMD